MTRDRDALISGNRDVLLSQLSSWIPDLNTMPRKKASDHTQSSVPRQPTLAGFINAKSASMATPGAESQQTAKTTKQSKSKSVAEPKIGTPASRRRSGTKRTRTKSPKKEVLARKKDPSDDSGDGSDPGTLQAIRFESQEEEIHTGGSTIELTSSSEDEDQIISPRLKRTTTQKMRAPSGSPSDSDVEVIGGSAGAPLRVKRRLKRRLMSSDEEDLTETEEEEGSSPKKRRLVKGLKPSISEEEIDLMDEVDEHRECHVLNGVTIILHINRADDEVGIIGSRLRAREKKTVFQRSLETLKRTLPTIGGILLSQIRSRTKKWSVCRVTWFIRGRG